MAQITFCEPSRQHKEAVLNYRSEFLEAGENLIYGAPLLCRIDRTAAKTYYYLYR